MSVQQGSLWSGNLGKELPRYFEYVGPCFLWRCPQCGHSVVTNSLEGRRRCLISWSCDGIMDLVAEEDYLFVDEGSSDE